MSFEKHNISLSFTISIVKQRWYDPVRIVCFKGACNQKENIINRNQIIIYSRFKSVFTLYTKNGVSYKNIKIWKLSSVAYC